MNERIQELINEATSGPKWVPLYKIDKVLLEKFAELIIKETLQVARVGMEYGPSMEDAVYKYFGVEDQSDEIKYCPTCGEEWSGTSCGIDNCGWITG